MDTLDETPGQNGPRTLRRGLQVLHTLLAASCQGMTVSALARETGLQRPTVYRLLAALVDSGFVNEVEGTKRYAAVLASHRSSLAQDDAANHLVSTDSRVQLALPVMRHLADATGDAVFLVVREGHESLTLWREIGPYPVQILATYAGKRQPLGVGSGGLALLAALDHDTTEQIIQHNSDKLEQYGGMTAREMRQLVSNTRTRGYAVVGNYAVRGALGVACALTKGKENPVLSISVTAITERMPTTRQREIAGLIRRELESLKEKI
ncbi:MAG: IclR family transcriptional regulator [Burkholderiaceae bacterium]